MRARKSVVTGLVAGLLCAAPAASYAYGPGGDQPTPPGFGETLSTCQTSDDGGCTVAGDWNKCHLKVQVPAKSFAHKVTVVVSKITNVNADKHLKKQHSICAFGVGFFRDGHRVHVADGRPSVNLIFTGDVILASDHMRILVPGDGSKPKHASFSTHQATTTVRTTRELAIVRPNS